MRTLILSGLFLLSTLSLYAQGTNNNYDYDKEDLNNIFNELGIKTFKFPIHQRADQFLNIVVEEYENKKLLKKISVIDDVRQTFGKIGIEGLSYFKPAADSVYFHRFYFFKKDSTLKMQIRAHGISQPLHFQLSGKSLYSINTYNDDNGPVDEPKILLYLYANSIEEKDKPLWCPNGLSKEQLLERFYYFIFVTIEPYKDE